MRPSEEVASAILAGRGNVAGNPPFFRAGGPFMAVPDPALIAAIIMALVQLLGACQPGPVMGYAWLTRRDFGRWDWLPWRRERAARDKAVRTAVRQLWKWDEDDADVFACQLFGYADNALTLQQMNALWDEAKADKRRRLMLKAMDSPTPPDQPRLPPEEGLKF